MKVRLTFMSGQKYVSRDAAPFALINLIVLLLTDFSLKPSILRNGSCRKTPAFEYVRIVCLVSFILTSIVVRTTAAA